LFYQPNIHNDSENLNFSKKILINGLYLNKFSFFSPEGVLVAEEDDAAAPAAPAFLEPTLENFFSNSFDSDSAVT